MKGRPSDASSSHATVSDAGRPTEADGKGWKLLHLLRGFSSLHSLPPFFRHRRVNGIDILDGFGMEFFLIYWGYFGVILGLVNEVGRVGGFDFLLGELEPFFY